MTFLVTLRYLILSMLPQIRTALREAGSRKPTLQTSCTQTRNPEKDPLRRRRRESNSPVNPQESRRARRDQLHPTRVHGVHLDPVPDRARLGPEAVLPGENGTGRSNRLGVRGADPHRVQRHVHRGREIRVSLSA